MREEKVAPISTPKPGEYYRRADGSPHGVHILKVEKNPKAFGGYSVFIQYEDTDQIFDKDLITFHSRFYRVINEED